MTLLDTDELTPPEPDHGDSAHAVARAVLDGIPVVGSAAVELLQAIITPPLERRRNEWMSDVAEAIRELQRRGLRPEKLRDDPVFIDTVLSASQAAIRTSQAEKRHALRNAVINSALPGAPDVAIQQMFIALVDRFTEWHLRLLKLFQEPGEPYSQAGGAQLYMGGLSSVLETVYPELTGRRSFYDLVWSDLNAAGLLNTSTLHVTMSGQGLLAKRTTELGDTFLAFISEPS
jgi:hypothetical protein